MICHAQLAHGEAGNADQRIAISIHVQMQSEFSSEISNIHVADVEGFVQKMPEQMRSWICPLSQTIINVQESF